MEDTPTTEDLYKQIDSLQETLMRMSLLAMTALSSYAQCGLTNVSGTMALRGEICKALDIEIDPAIRDHFLQSGRSFEPIVHGILVARAQSI